MLNIFSKIKYNYKHSNYYQYNISIVFSKVRNEYLQKYSSIKKDTLYPKAKKLYYCSYTFQSIYSIYKEYYDLKPPIEQFDEFIKEFEIKLEEKLADIYKYKDSKKVSVRNNKRKKINTVQPTTKKDPDIFVTPVDAVKENKTNKTTKKDELIEEWGYDLAKYKFPKEFGIYKLDEKEIGDRYERYIGYLYETDDYKVDFQGLTKGLKDGGIDIIAKKKKEILIIQCKRYGKDSTIHENTIHQLNSVVQFYKSKNENKEVRGILYSVNDNLDEEAREVLEYFELEHIVEPHPLNEDYPLVKCNITDKKYGKQKIYHLPVIGMYDRIKIEQNKGESYVYTELEAQELGFRKANI